MAPSIEILCLPVGWSEMVARAPIAEAARALSLFSDKISSSSLMIGLFAMSWGCAFEMRLVRSQAPRANMEPGICGVVGCKRAALAEDMNELSKQAQAWGKGGT